MLINLLPDFFAVLNSTDPVAAYNRYFQNHRHRLAAYWNNYVLDPDGPHYESVARMAALADRADLRSMLERIDVVSLARDTEERARDLLASDVDIDVILMVGVGAANAGELVVAGRGMAFVCLEHFTGVANPETRGLGLDPELIPMWLAHEIAHAVRYTSPTSRSELRELVDEADGYYSYWDTGRRASLRELLVNEGIAVQVARMVSPGHAAWEYLGYARRQFARIRELEPVISRAAWEELDQRALGLRLKYLSGGVGEQARAVDKYIIPERAGYYIGSQMVASALEVHGPAWTVRASAQEILAAGDFVVATA